MIVNAKVYRRLSGKMRGVLVLFALIVAPLSLLGSQSGSTDKSEATGDEKVISSDKDKPAFSDDNSQSAKTRQVEPQTPASNEAGEVFQTALEAITNNYENLRTVAVTFEVLNVAPSVERREKVSGENENGCRWSMTIAPVFIGRSVVTLEGRNLRSESYDRVGSDWNHVSTQVRKDDIWTTFHRSANWAQRKSTEGLGSIFPRDPRDFGGLAQRYGLLEQMRRSEAKRVSRRDGIADVIAEIVNRPKYGYEPRQRFTYSFDTRRNFLPTQVIRHYGDGSINVLTELSHEEVVPGKSWFVREMTQKFFMEEVAAKNPDSDGWHQLLVYRSVGPIRINEDLNDDFKIDIPRGIRIR